MPLHTTYSHVFISGTKGPISCTLVGCHMKLFAIIWDWKHTETKYMDNQALSSSDRKGFDLDSVGKVSYIQPNLTGNPFT